MEIGQVKSEMQRLETEVSQRDEGLRYRSKTTHVLESMW
jgi:hypothetical protein